MVTALSFRPDEAKKDWMEHPALFVDVIPKIDPGDSWATSDMHILESWRGWFISQGKPFIVVKYEDGSLALWKRVKVSYRIR